MINFHIISPLIWNTFQTDFNLPDNLNIQTIFPQLAKFVLPKVEVMKKVTGKRVALLSCFQFEIRRLFSQFDRSSFIYSSVSGYVKEATRRAGGEGGKKTGARHRRNRHRLDETINIKWICVLLFFLFLTFLISITLAHSHNPIAETGERCENEWEKSRCPEGMEMKKWRKREKNAS